MDEVRLTSDVPKTMTAQPATRAAPLPMLVQRHVEEAALLCNQRMYLVGAPHVKLQQLRRLDDRLAANLDGLLVAGDTGSRLADAALANAGRGEVFTAVSLAFDNHDHARLDRLLAVGESLPEVQEAVELAVGWVSAASLNGITRELLASRSAFRRRLALAACAMHRVDPGAALPPALAQDEVPLRARALQTAGECARQDLLPACLSGLTDPDGHCRLQAARSALLLGERGAVLMDALYRMAGSLDATGDAAMFLFLKVAGPGQAVPLMRLRLDEPRCLRAAIRGMGMAGDPQVVPWLLAQMENPALARLAGEALSTMTGVDLAWLDLERPPPDTADAGPGADDAPQDAGTGMDEDAGLPWPDPSRLQAWWRAHEQEFQRGTRYFMGQPPSPAHCLRVLREGFQRQRIAAAEHQCLLQPGTRLFPAAAPAWRQQRWLGAMEA